MTHCTFVYAPILAWPGVLIQGGYREPSPFSASWDSTMDVLDREVWALGGEREATIMLAHPPHAFRADGGIHAKFQDKAPQHPGVILVVKSQHGELTYATDKFKGWRNNVRAIALGLESLRRVERYGIGDAGQQYVGYKALGTGMPMGVRPAALSLGEAAQILAHGFGDGSTYKEADVLADFTVARRCYVQAAQVLHPDKPTGDDEKFKRLDEAWRLVQRHHGR